MSSRGLRHTARMRAASAKRGASLTEKLTAQRDLVLWWVDRRSSTEGGAANRSDTPL